MVLPRSACLLFAALACAPKAGGPAPESASASPSPQSIQLPPGFGEALGSFGGPRPEQWDVAPEAALVPVGRWVTTGSVDAFTYIDPTEGLSAQALVPMPEELAAAIVDPASDGPGVMSLIVRLDWRGPNLRELTESERLARGLPETPEWLEVYGPQPPPGTYWGTWRLDPRLRERFLPDYPDDLQVIFASDPPSERGFELMWVRVTGCDASECRGRLLNQPFHLKHVREGDEVAFSLDAAKDGFYLLEAGRAGPEVPIAR